MGLLFCEVDAVCGASFCKVAKSACAAERFPADKSCPNFWTSCCTCCFWLCGLADSSKSKRLLLEIPETDMKISSVAQAARMYALEFNSLNRSATASTTLVPSADRFWMVLRAGSSPKHRLYLPECAQGRFVNADAASAHGSRDRTQRLFNKM